MIDEEQNNEDLRATMNIIIFSGDARALIMHAMDLIGDFKYDEAETLMKDAHTKLVEAHALQTNKVQQEADGKKIEYSVLFTHAQDTLMTVNTEYNMVHHLIKIFRKRDEAKQN